MNWKNIFGSSALTGGLLALFILTVFVFVGLDPGSFVGLFVIFFGLGTLSAIIVNQLSKRVEWSEVSLKILIPVGCLTSVIPLFGPLLGLPNTKPLTLATVVVMGAFGAIFWSIPFVGWNYYKHGNNMIAEVDTEV